MAKKKMRIAVPYTDRMLVLPNSGFYTLAEALWNTTRDDCEVLKLHESELLARSDYDVVFLIRRRIAADQAVLDHFARTNKRIAVWLDDLHFYRWRVPYVPRQLLQVFDLADLVFVTYFHQLRLWRPYQRFLDKVVWSPWSVPDWIFEFSEPWSARKDRVLVSGACGVHYPLRRRLFRYGREGAQDIIDTLEHPGYDKAATRGGTTGRAFYALLGSYRGAVATTAASWCHLGRNIDYTVAKYVELPACGCLPFMEETPDLRELGFREGEHYVSINRWNYRQRLDAIRSTEAEGIAKAAQGLVRQRHTHSRRVGLILDEITRRFARHE